MKRLQKFFYYFGNNKKSFVQYSLLSFIVGLLELLGVALTYPFVIKLLSNNSKLWISVCIGVGIVILFLAKNAFMIFYTYLQTHFVKRIEAEINLKFFQYFVSADYQKTSKISLAKKSNIMGFLVNNTINNYILRILNLSVNLFIFGLISLFLIIKFPFAMLITGISATILITVQNAIFKPRLEKVAQQLNKSSLLFNKNFNDALLNIKSVKISNNEKFFFENYHKAIKEHYKNCSKISFFQSVPPYITEPVIIILLFILLTLISVQTFMEPAKMIASFALIVSAIFRLAPTISRIQVNLNGINATYSIVDELLDIAKNYELDKLPQLNHKEFMTFTSEIKLTNINFGYSNDTQVLKDINLTIKKGEFIGIAGLSGCGKTTLADIISGLLRADGEITVDGQPMTNPLKIGYIPQEFNTINASVRENVAFGFSEIDDEKVIKALKQAQLYDYIEAKLPQGIYSNPFVDSSGFSLGQKQRLAIARALYLNPDILILDEATSSLDLKTEDEICNVLKLLKGEKTIIAIAHRLSTIKFADKIVYMKNGKIIETAPFEDLITQNNDFKELVKLASVQNT